jgi:hypothetical protein
MAGVGFFSENGYNKKYFEWFLALIGIINEI